MNDSQHRQDMYSQTNQASIDYSKMVFNGAFFLNGAAATALLASKVSVFYWPAILFSLGALVALCGMGVSYLYILLIAETWRSDPGDFEEKTIHVYFAKRLFSFSMKEIEDKRLMPIFLALLSLAIFLAGLLLLALADWPA